MLLNRFLPQDDSGEPEIFIERQLPANIKDDDLKYFQPQLFVALRNISVKELGYFLLFKDGIILKKGIYKESTLYYSEKIALSYYLKSIISGILKFKCICLFKGVYAVTFNKWSNNYFHWFTEVLPRILFINEKYPDVTFLFLFKLNEQYQKPSLKKIGVKFYNNDKHFIFIRKSIISSPFANYSGQFIPSLVLQVGAKLMYAQVEGGQGLISHQFIYLQRRASNRRVINERDVINTFKSFGFQVVSFDNLSLDEQIAILSKTEVLASIHGAGLTNMLFMANGKKVLEICKENETLDKCYFNLASALGLEYWYLFCKAKDPSATYTDADIFVDLNKLELILKQMTHNDKP